MRTGLTRGRTALVAPSAPPAGLLLVPVEPPAGAVPPAVAAAAGGAEAPREHSRSPNTAAVRNLDRLWTPVLAKKIPSGKPPRRVIGNRLYRSVNANRSAEAKLRSAPAEPHRRGSRRERA